VFCSIQQDICQQGLACSDRTSNQQFDDDESGSDPELVNLFRTNNSCSRRDHEARQAPPKLTPQNASWSPRPPAYQQSPRPPSITVDDMRMVAEGNITPDPWEPHTHVPDSIRRRDVVRRRLPTPTELENCCSPTMDEMMQGLTKANVCYCKRTGVHNTTEKDITVKPTMFSSSNDSKNLVTRDWTPSCTYFPVPVGSHSSKTSNQEESTARRNNDSTAPVSVRMISMGTEHKLGSQLDVINGSCYELDRISSQPSRRRLPDVSSQPPTGSYFQQF